MNAKYHNLLQTIVIVALSVSATNLFIKIQLYNLGEEPSGYLVNLFTEEEVAIGEETQYLADLSAPVAVAVSTPFGRYGSPHLATQNEAFEPLASVLSQALSSLDAVQSSSEWMFEQSLKRASVYYDFYTPLPLSVIAGLVGTEIVNTTGVAQRLVLDLKGELVYLSWWDGEDGYYQSKSAMTEQSFRSVLETYQGGDVFFAFEGEYVSDELSKLDPFSLFSSGGISYYEATTKNPIEDNSQVLLRLGFNPHTQFRYTESNGTEVIQEGERMVRISPNGIVEYESNGQDAVVQIPALKELPTDTEAATGAGKVLQEMLGTMAGDGRLYLQSMERTQWKTVMTFNYQLNGMPIVFADGIPAASVTIEGTTVTAISMRVRQYFMTETPGLLLPVAQAAAVAESESRLHLIYVDDGIDNMKVQWVTQ